MQVQVTAIHSQSKAILRPGLVWDTDAIWIPQDAVGGRTLLEWLAEFNRHLTPPSNNPTDPDQDMALRRKYVMDRLKDGRTVTTYTLEVAPLAKES